MKKRKDRCKKKRRFPITISFSRWWYFVPPTLVKRGRIAMFFAGVCGLELQIGKQHIILKWWKEV